MTFRQKINLIFENIIEVPAIEAENYREVMRPTLPDHQLKPTGMFINISDENKLPSGYGLRPWQWQKPKNQYYKTDKVPVKLFDPTIPDPEMVEYNKYINSIEL